MRTALITGVSRRKGIGAAIARELANNGINLFCTYWTDYDKAMPWGVMENEPSEIQQEILDMGIDCEMLSLDLSCPTGPEELFQRVLDRFGCPDILVNNATYSTDTNYKTITPEEIDKHYFINLRATAMLCALFGRHYDKSERGKIINLTSGQSLGPMAGEIAYAATKGAIDAMTITMARELSFCNICINTINPGPCDSGWISKELSETLRPMFPFGRIGMPTDAAKLIGFLASPASDWITGQVIHSEGGFMRG